MVDNADVYAEEGLKINGTDMSQIPTFVTGVPDGTEKVRKRASMMAEVLTIVGSIPRC